MTPDTRSSRRRRNARPAEARVIVKFDAASATSRLSALSTLTRTATVSDRPVCTRTSMSSGSIPTKILKRSRSPYVGETTSNTRKLSIASIRRWSGTIRIVRCSGISRC
jgi:hypothetical protein